MVQNINVNCKGEVIAELSYSLDEIKDTVYIKSVYVDIEYRGKGIAKNIVIDLLKKHLEKKVMLDCTKTSKKIWKKMGFVFKGITSHMSISDLLILKS